MATPGNTIQPMGNEAEQGQGNAVPPPRAPLPGLHGRGRDPDGFRLDIKKNFNLTVVRHGNRWPSKAVNAPSLEMFKIRPDEVLSNLF